MPVCVSCVFGIGYRYVLDVQCKSLILIGVGVGNEFTKDRLMKQDQKQKKRGGKTTEAKVTS